MTASLLEREAVLGSFRSSLEEARKGRGRLVLVVGEAGIGKSSAVHAFCDESRGSARVLWGGCDPLFTPRPLGPFLDIAEQAGGELQAAVEQGPPEVAAALLRTAAERSATIVVLDDVHWADEATLDALRLLGRKLGQAPLLLVATYRDDELDRMHPLRIVLGELATQPQVDRVPIQPLSPAAVAELATNAEIDAAELYRLTGGNPFYVTEVLASDDRIIPSTVRDAVLARAARLTESARMLLDAVAIASPHVELWLLETLVAELTPLEECLGSGMLISETGAISFRHELARITFEEAIPPHRKRALHRAALRALEVNRTSAEDFARLAHHADAAGETDAVLRFAPAAAERAASLGAHREAAAQFARALRFGDQLPLERRAELSARRAHECYLTSQIDEAIPAQRDALECRRALGDIRGEGDALRSLSRLLNFAGRPDEGEPMGLDAVTLLEGLTPARELAVAYGNVSQRHAVVEDWEAAVAWGDRALELAERLGDTDALVYALTTLGVVDASADAEGGREKLEQALAIARRHGLEDHAGRAFIHLVQWPLRQRRFDLVDDVLQRGLEYSAERGLDTWRLYLLALRARLELMVGRYGAAADSAGAVLQDPRSPFLGRNWAMTALGSLRARRGDPQAAALLRDAYTLAEPTRELICIGPAAAARGELAWLAGDHAGAGRATEIALTLALERRAPWVAGELAYWRWRAGVRDHLPAEALAEPYRVSIGGDWAVAAEQWAQIGCPYEAALALADADEEEPLRRAHEELQRLGARPAAAIVARRLQERGVRNVPRGPRPSTRNNKAQLTARELEVLQLLGEGLRNAVIAERLFLSPRTVDHHVAAILRKLDAKSRGAAVAEAGRLGLFQDPQPARPI